MPTLHQTGNGPASDIAVFWAGTNNRADPDRVVADIRAMVGALRALDKRFLVVGPLNSATDTSTSGNANYLGVKAIEDRLLSEYGRRFLNLRRYLIDYGLADRGISPTAQDAADIANDVIPSSLRSDSIHQNNDGKAVTAAQVEFRLREMGWA